MNEITDTASTDRGLRDHEGAFVFAARSDVARQRNEFIRNDDFYLIENNRITGIKGA